MTKPIATRSSGETRLLSNEYLMKNATPRNSASPPSHAKQFHAHELFPVDGRFGFARLAGAGFGGGAVWANTGGGATTGGGTGGMMIGFCVGSGAGGIILGCAAGAGGVGADAVNGSDFGVDSLSCLSRKISDSSSYSRRASSSMRLLALTAHTINQMASARGTPRIKKTTGIQSISFTFQQPRSLIARSVRPAAGSWQAAMHRHSIASPNFIFMRQRYRLLAHLQSSGQLKILLVDRQKINAAPFADFINEKSPPDETSDGPCLPVPQKLPAVMPSS